MDPLVIERSIFRLSNAIVAHLYGRDSIDFAEQVEDEVLVQAAAQAGVSREALFHMAPAQIRANAQTVRWYHIILETILERLRDPEIATPRFWAQVNAGGGRSARPSAATADGPIPILNAEGFVGHFKPEEGGWASAPLAIGRGERGKKARHDAELLSPLIIKDPAVAGPDGLTSRQGLSKNAELVVLAQSLDEALSWPRVASNASVDVGAEIDMIDENEVRRMYGGKYLVLKPRAPPPSASTTAGGVVPAASNGLGLEALLGLTPSAAPSGGPAVRGGRGAHLRGRGRGSRGGGQLTQAILKGSILDKPLPPSVQGLPTNRGRGGLSRGRPRGKGRGKGRGTATSSATAAAAAAAAYDYNASGAGASDANDYVPGTGIGAPPAQTSSSSGVGGGVKLKLKFGARPQAAAPQPPAEAIPGTGTSSGGAGYGDSGIAAASDAAAYASDSGDGGQSLLARRLARMQADQGQQLQHPLSAADDGGMAGQFEGDEEEEAYADDAVEGQGEGEGEGGYDEVAAAEGYHDQGGGDEEGAYGPGDAAAGDNDDAYGGLDFSAGLDDTGVMMMGYGIDPSASGAAAVAPADYRGAPVGLGHSDDDADGMVLDGGSAL